MFSKDQHPREGRSSPTILIKKIVPDCCQQILARTEYIGIERRHAMEICRWLGDISWKILRLTIALGCLADLHANWLASGWIDLIFFVKLYISMRRSMIVSAKLQNQALMLERRRLWALTDQTWNWSTEIQPEESHSVHTDSKYCNDTIILHLALCLLPTH